MKDMVLSEIFYTAHHLKLTNILEDAAPPSTCVLSATKL